MNKLITNIDKTKYMLLNSPIIQRPITIKINDKLIEPVSYIKYLGVVLDNKLTFEPHIDHVCKKVSKKLYVLRKMRKNISKTSAIKVYNVIVKPHFEYCASLLFLCNVTQKNRLQKLQNRAMRTILKCDRYTPISLLINSLNWLNINQRLYAMTMILVFKIKNNLCPHYLTTNLPQNRTLNYDLRSPTDFNIHRTRTVRAQRSILYNGLQTFNMLPVNIRNISNFNTFKRTIYEYSKNNVN